MPAGDCPACPWAELLTPPYREQGWDIPKTTCGPGITWLPSTAACKPSGPAQCDQPFECSLLNAGAGDPQGHARPRDHGAAGSADGKAGEGQGSCNGEGLCSCRLALSRGW